MTRRTLALAGLITLASCDPSSDGEVREWTPADHDQPSANANQGPQVADRPDSPATNMSLVELAWQKNCVLCHGARGRGDGPQGPMLRVADLTRAEWQDKVSDQEIAETIRKGRNKMPAFDLPAPVLDGLVKRIRASRAQK
jgi:mono/diheme cytochrome c family protein